MANSLKAQASGYTAGDNELKSILEMLNLDGATVDYLITPCTHFQAAELLGVSPGTLKNLRSRGGGPKGWAILPGIGGRYRSRLDVLVWFREQHRLATTECSQRDAAA